MYESIKSACKVLDRFGLPRAVGSLVTDRFIVANKSFLRVIGLVGLPRAIGNCRFPGRYGIARKHCLLIVDLHAGDHRSIGVLLPTSKGEQRMVSPEGHSHERCSGCLGLKPGQQMEQLQGRHRFR